MCGTSASTVRVAAWLTGPCVGSYSASDSFKLAHMVMGDGVAGKELFDIAQRITPNVAYFLPRNVDQTEVCAAAARRRAQVRCWCDAARR